MFEQLLDVLRQYIMFSKWCFLAISSVFSYWCCLFILIFYLVGCGKLEVYERKYSSALCLYPDGTADAVGEETGKYGKITGRRMWCRGNFGSWRKAGFQTQLKVCFLFLRQLYTSLRPLKWFTIYINTKGQQTTDFKPGQTIQLCRQRTMKILTFYLYYLHEE